MKVTPGDYRTADGRRVTVVSTGGKGTFPVKGSVWRIFRGKLRPRGYAIWTADGRYLAHTTSCADLVEAWKE